jgi:MYXO-CTERM domain-containing protein
MKGLNIKRIIGVSALVLSFAVMTALPTFAQPNSNNANTGRGERADTTRVVERDNDTDWGWLGLLGLLGLAGLIPKKRRVEVQEFRDTNQPAQPPRSNV